MAKQTLRLRDWLFEEPSSTATVSETFSHAPEAPNVGEEDWSALFADEIGSVTEETDMQDDLFSSEDGSNMWETPTPQAPAPTPASPPAEPSHTVIPHPFGLPETLSNHEAPSPPETQRRSIFMESATAPAGESSSTSPQPPSVAPPRPEPTTGFAWNEEPTGWDVSGVEGLPHNIQGLVNAFAQQLIALLLAIHRGEIVPQDAFLPVVDQLLDLLEEHPEQGQTLEQILLENPLETLSGSNDTGGSAQAIMEDLALHLLNVTFYVYKVGKEVLAPSNLRLAVRTAAIHDLGMARLPLGLLVERGVFSQQQREMMQLHPLETQDLVRAIYPDQPELADLVVQEQERFNGSGYPAHLTGEAIHPIARLVGLIDTFEAMIHPRPYRKRLLPVEAVQRIVRELKGVFDPRQVKGLINNISVFPVGTYVQLNTKEIGRVVQTYRESPLRPKIEILYNEAKQKLSIPRSIDLSKTPLIFITKSLYPEDVEASIRRG